MNNLFEVLAEPNRRLILHVLRDGEQPVGAIVDRLAISQSGVSRHLRLLRQAGLVEVRSDAQSRLYRLQPKPLQHIDTWLEPYRAFWNHHLDKLEQHLDTLEKGDL